MKATRIATVALCLLILVLPSVAMPIFPSRDDGAEKRYLADYPALATEDGLNPDFDTEFEAWLSDHFALRQQAVRANATIDYRLLRTSPNRQVIVGAGDWLYFEETVPDYTGEGRFTPEELQTIAGNLDALARSLAARGARLFIAVVPNKSTVYPQNMPGRYAMRDDGGNIPLLREACAGIDARWIDLVQPLQALAAGDRLVYYRTDTHWNALGAAKAAEILLTEMGREAVGWTNAGDAEFTGGDLARLMGLGGQLGEEAPLVAPDAPLPEADYEASRLTVPGDGEGRLAVYRDSFGTAVGPWLASAYGETEMRWEFPLDGGIDCDDALVLLCERNLRKYLTPPPVITEAPEPAPDEGEDELDDFEDFNDADDSFFDDADEDEFEDLDEADADFFDDADDDFEDFDEADDSFFEDAEGGGDDGI